MFSFFLNSKKALRKFLIFYFSLFVLFLSVSFAQGNYTSVNKNIYSFFNRIAVKRLVDFQEFVKPLTRSQISFFLEKLKTNSQSLTKIERQEFDWYLQEYGYELEKSKDEMIETFKDGRIQSSENLADSTSNLSTHYSGLTSKFTLLSAIPRSHFFTYTDNDFHIVADPILGFGIVNNFKEMQYHRWNGINIYGSYGKHFGFNFSFRDNWEKGDKADKIKQFSNVPGINIVGGKDNDFEYSEVNANITYETKNFILSVGKDFLEVGSGYRGKLIQSTKAPSFPFIRCDFYPVEWLSFNYFHGWLNSKIIDSSKIYLTSIKDQNRIKYRDKYIANHSISIRPLIGLDISFGESIIYGDGGLNILYLIPVSFFRLADHYESQGSNNAGSNSQFFLDINARLFRGLQFYSTLFIDELSISKLLKGETDRNQFGFTVGLYNYGTIGNLGLRLEYTRILPWVYSNYIPSQTYSSSGYSLGHYIGQNADQIFIQIDYKFIRGLEVKFFGEHIRRGSISDIKNQYELPGEEFLYGLQRNETNIGLEFSYEFIHDLFVKGFYQYSYITDEDKSRTPDWQLGKNQSFAFSLYYGL